MRYIILSLFLLLCTASASDKKLEPFEIIQEKKKYYSLKEYQKNNLTEIYPEYIKILEQHKTYKTEFSKNMPDIQLKKIYNNFDEIVKNKNFFNKYSIDNLNTENLNILVYSNNKAIIKFSGENAFDAYTKCFFINYYLLTIQKDILKVLYIDGEGGQIVMPL